MATSNDFDNENIDSSGNEEGPNKAPEKNIKNQQVRHTLNQIQQMEAFFQKKSHPNSKERKELSFQIGLDPLKIKYWFQNKRNQEKIYQERNNKPNLQSENDMLRAENVRLKSALVNASCHNCGPVVRGETSLEQLQIDNSNLREQVDRYTTMFDKFTSNRFSHPYPSRRMASGQSGIDMAKVFEVTVNSMEELITMARMGQPLWVPAIDGSPTINEEEYIQAFTKGIGPKLNGFKSESSKETAIVNMNHLDLLGILMDANQWSNVFSSIVYSAKTLKVLSAGVSEGNNNGALQVMSAEVYLPSPFVPTREIYFVRFCKDLSDGIWAVMDVSIDSLRPDPVMRCRRRPSGCLIRNMSNGQSEVTWIEHIEVNENGADYGIYASIVNSRLAFGARRWLLTLVRECNRLKRSNYRIDLISEVENGVIPPHRRGWNSMLKLTKRMVRTFCLGLSASTAHNWTIMPGTAGTDIVILTRLSDIAMTQLSTGGLGAPSSGIVTAATSFSLPVSASRVLDFLCNHTTRPNWDIFTRRGFVQEIAHVDDGEDTRNCVSLFRINSNDISQSKILILEECCTDSSGSYLVYAVIDKPAMNVVFRGGDADYVAICPSGIAILPDGAPSPAVHNDDEQVPVNSTGGCVLTVAFQIQVNLVPTGEVPHEWVATIKNVVGGTVQRIKSGVVGGRTV